MVYQYVVTLKNTSRKSIDALSLLLLGVSALLFLRQQWYSDNIKIIYLFGAIAIIAIIAWNIYRRRKTGKPVYYSGALAIAAVGWVTMPFLPWLFIPFLLLALAERQAKYPLEIGFTDDRIVLNTLIRRKYRWSDFNNIILKDDLLTLDFKNNRILQRETVDEEGDADEDEFNSWCRARLNRVETV
jgi:NADH:ubiquinone oxidoreductase subunit 6 (subunit J)